MLDIFRALANPYRLSIVELLYKKERRPRELEKALKMTRGGLERHLKQLLDCGLIEKETFIEEGRAKVKYSLSKEAREFFEKARELTQKFVETKKTPPDKRERIKLLETRVKTLYDSIEEVNRLYADKSIPETDYFGIKESYLRELIDIEKEMAQLAQAG